MDWNLVLEYAKDNWIEIAITVYGGILYGAKPALARRLDIVGQILEYLRETKSGISPKKEK